jgi:putative DNA methylase
VTVQEAKKTEMTEWKSFIETDRFPVAVVSQASSKEKQIGGRPDYWEMVFWWTRKPLASARAIVAASLLPASTDSGEFLRAMNLDKKSPHRFNPVLTGEMRRSLQGKRVLDPFAGFGSIPLEAVRLGLSATAVELLPAGYVFLKTILEYPLKLGDQILKDVSRYGSMVTERLRNDSEIQSLYADNEVLIGSWEVKCPHCHGWTPLVGNYWLSRVKKSAKGYSSLAWFAYEKVHGKLEARVTDLSNEHDLGKAVVDRNKVTIGKSEFKVPSSNISPKSESAICLLCDGTIRFIDPITGKHYLESKGLPKEIAARIVWYVKYAVSSFNEGKEGYARHAFIVRVKLGNRLTFEPCSPEDQTKLEEARKITDRLVGRLDPDIPKERLAPYGTTAIGGYLQPINYNMNQWFRLFNPRQLLLHTKLVKLIREVGKFAEREKLASIPKEEARYHAEAITTYLAIALASEVDFNSLTSRWESTKFTKVNRTFTARGVSMVWNWCDSNPYSGYVGSWTNCLKNVEEALKYLITATTPNPGLGVVSNPQVTVSEPGRSIVELDDATVLSHLSSSDKFDLIVTDPPYYQDVPYSELSDFYYVWLKRALSDTDGKRLIPRFLAAAFFKKLGGEDVEILTQWETFATREVSLNPPRLGEAATLQEGIDYFQSLLDSAFLTMNSFLRDEGCLVTYYAHTNPDAWKALLKSGWQVSGSKVANAFPLTTESSESLIKRGKLSLDTSIVVVWRKGSSGSIQASVLYEQMAKASARRTRLAIEMGVRGRDLFVGALAAALSQATSYKEIIEMKKLDTSELMDRYVLRASLYGLAKAISQKANVEEGIKSNEGLFYLVTKFLYSGSQKKVITYDDARIFSLGTGVDLAHSVNNLRMFRTGSEDEEGEGSSLARRKTLILLDPQTKDKAKLKDLLYFRGVEPENPKVRSSIDALHLLEYFALAAPRDEFFRTLTSLKTKYPSETDEALGLAKVISGSLEDDVEGELCVLLVEKSKGSGSDIRDYSAGL